jgi:DnaJ like chaperone protein
MSYWGKLLGGVAGFAMGGPFGAVVGAAADQGAVPHMRMPGTRGFSTTARFGPARVAALFGRRDQLFAIGVVVLSAKLAKCDGPVSRPEIDSFKRQFRIPPQSARDIGRLFDQARDSSEGYEQYASQLGEAFADHLGLLEDVMTALFAIARSDGAVNWDRARGARARVAAEEETDPYAVLGLTKSASNDEARQAWLRLMRENHPDSLASRGVPEEFVSRANDKVARINAAWDRIKRERGL